MSDKEKIVVHIDPDIEELIPRFLDGRHKDVTTIEDLLKAGEYKKIRTIGHSLKGNGAGYGFDKLSEIGHAIELAAQEQNQEHIEQSLVVIKDYLSRIEIVFDRL